MLLVEDHSQYPCNYTGMTNRITMVTLLLILARTAQSVDQLCRISSLYAGWPGFDWLRSRYLPVSCKDQDVHLYAYEQTSCRMHLSFLPTGSDSFSPQKRSNFLVPKIMTVIMASNGSTDINSHTVTVKIPIPLTVWSKLYACSRSIAGIAVSIRMEGMDICLLCLLCVVKVVISATGCSPVQRSPTSCFSQPQQWGGLSRSWAFVPQEMK